MNLHLFLASNVYSYYCNRCFLAAITFFAFELLRDFRVLVTSAFVTARWHVKICSTWRRCKVSFMSMYSGKKRKLDDEVSETGPPSIVHGDVWFDDGNVVIMAEEIGFKVSLHFLILLFNSDVDLLNRQVYRGILSQHSEVFRDMFNMPRPSESNVDAVDSSGCAIVRVSDTPKDIGYVLSMLFNSSIGYQFHVAE